MYKINLLILLCAIESSASLQCKDIFRLEGSIKAVSEKFNRRMTVEINRETLAYPAALNDPANVGKVVEVSFKIDEYGNATHPTPVVQRISSINETDTATKNLLGRLRVLSLSGEFKESAGWLIYTKSGRVYSTEPFVGDSFTISHHTMWQTLWPKLNEIQRQESRIEITDIEFFHTHLDAGEAFTPPDVEGHQSLLGLIEAKLNQNAANYFDPATFVSHAVPVNGRTFFSFKQPNFTDQ